MHSSRIHRHIYVHTHTHTHTNTHTHTHKDTHHTHTYTHSHSLKRTPIHTSLNLFFSLILAQKRAGAGKHTTKRYRLCSEYTHSSASPTIHVIDTKPPLAGANRKGGGLIWDPCHRDLPDRHRAQRRNHKRIYSHTPPQPKVLEVETHSRL